MERLSNDNKTSFNVFLINTLHDYESDMIKLEKLFKDLRYNVYGAISNVTYKKLKQRLGVFKEKIHGNISCFIFYGKGFGDYILTTDNCAIHVDEIRRDLNYPILYTSPHFFIRNICYYYPLPHITFLDKEVFTSGCMLKIGQKDEFTLDKVVSSFNVASLLNLCQKAIFSEKERLFQHIKELPKTLAKSVDDYIKIQNWRRKKFQYKSLEIETFRTTDLSILTNALQQVFIENQAQDLHFKHFPSLNFWNFGCILHDMEYIVNRICIERDSFGPICISGVFSLYPICVSALPSKYWV